MERDTVDDDNSNAMFVIVVAPNHIRLYGKTRNERRCACARRDSRRCMLYEYAEQRIIFGVIHLAAPHAII